MITITPKRGALQQTNGAIIHFDDGEEWTSDYRSIRSADGSVRFQIENTFLTGSDIILDGQRHPLIRFRGSLGAQTVLNIGTSEMEVAEERLPSMIRFSFGRWTADYDENTFTMTLDLKKEEPDFLFVLAGAHQIWVGQIGS